MAKTQYIELKCKTNYSFLTGASHPEELVQRAVELGLKGLALTDKDGVYGIPKAYHYSRDYPDFKFIVGADLTLQDHPRLTLIARDRKGYGLLCRIITASHANKPKGGAFLTLDELITFMNEPVSAGLIALPDDDLLTALPELDAPSAGGSSRGAPRPGAEIDLAQFHGEVTRTAFAETAVAQTEARIGAAPDAIPGKRKYPARYDILKELFDDRLYLPLTRYLDGKDKLRTRRLIELSRRWQAPLVATNDVHYHTWERRKLQDVMTAIRVNEPLQKAGFKLFSNGERYLKTPRQMAYLYKDIPEALSETLLIGEQCVFSPKELRYRYPSEWIPSQHTAQSYLEELTWDGARKRHKGDIPTAVVKQLEHELKLISQLEFADYFLTIFEIVVFARERGILCQGRGSAANSAVCYVLGITAVDPVRMNLLFERFISAERGEPPDIDVDFEHERREEVIQHIYEKYGRHRAAMVSAVVTYREKSAFREISKGLGVDVGTLSARKLEKEFDKAEKDSGIKNLRGVVDSLSQEMRGFPRHLSIHSGGFTLSADPIIEIVPVEPARMEGRTIIQWDKYDLDYLGLLKIDVLSLGMLSALKKTLALVNMELHEIPAEDKPTYAMIQKADTVGTFQIESRAQMSMLGRLLPKTFYDLVIQVAIVRPGPIIGKMVHPYLKRRRALEQGRLNEREAYPDPRVKPILEKTLGVPLFQEQVMQMAISLANFTPGEADQLRRAIGAWRANGDIQQMGDRLMRGMLNNGIPRLFAQRIFEQIQGFATYGFPESHSASFALIAYASSYLKCHHPAEFTCSLINSQPMGFYSNHTLVTDAQRHGVTVLPVHPNFSDWDCEMAGEDARSKLPSANTFRLGFRVVTGLAERDGRHIIEERKRGGEYKNLGDFLSRTHVRRDVLHRLAMGGAFTCFGYDERHSLWEMLEYDLLIRERDTEQLNLFSASETSSPGGGLSASGFDLFKALDDYEKMKEEYNAYRLTTSGHPMKALRRKVKGLPATTSIDAKKQKTGQIFSTAGLVVVRQRPPTAKGVTFCTLEDEFGFTDLILHAEVFEKYNAAFLNHSFLKVTGVIQKDTNTTSLLVKSIEPFVPDLEVAPHQTYF